jgi:hypothetical protein
MLNAVAGGGPPGTGVIGGTPTGAADGPPISPPGSGQHPPAVGHGAGHDG